ncbi:Proton/glutamate-aspartate symporter [Thalassocella blandensis]|nr:Proton/glutamate-aspartate symporter [Thalassocella blandensis]
MSDRRGNVVTDMQIGESLTKKILIALGAGIALGFVFNLLSTYFADSSLVTFIWTYVIEGVLKIGGTWFVNGLKMLVVPLVFVSLVCGVCSIGGSSRIGAISVKTLGFYLFTTAAAITLAMLVALVVDPGKGMQDTVTVKTPFEAKESPELVQVLIDLVPTNIVSSMANGSMLQVIVFALLFGIGLSRAGEKADLVKTFFIQLDNVIMRVVLIVMVLAPYGVFCLVTNLFATMENLSEIIKLGKYFLTVVAVLILHGFFVYGGLLTLLTGLKPLVFFNKMRRVWLFAFSSASSNATIPVTLDTVENRLGVNNEVASFTVPLGATINMDGTAIMQGVATVFIAQYYAIDIGLSGYLMVILTATLASIGTAGVPGVGLIMLTMVLSQVGLPAEGIALIIGIDRLLDMLRTAVNVTGDSAASIIVAKSEGLLNEDVFNDPNAEGKSD